MTPPTGITRLLRVTDLVASGSSHGVKGNTSEILLGVLSLSNHSVMGAALVFEDATGALPVIVTGIRDWDFETFQIFTVKKKAFCVAIVSWNLLSLVHAAKEETTQLCLEINASSSLLDGRTLSRHYDYNIPLKIIDSLEILNLSSKISRPKLSPSLDFLPIRLIAKSELSLFGKSRKTFMVKAECFIPTTQSVMASHTVYKLVAFILFQQGGVFINTIQVCVKTQSSVNESFQFITDLELIHESLNIGQHYYMQGLKPYKIKVAQDTCKKILVFHSGSRFLRCDPSEIPQATDFSTAVSQDQMNDYAFACHSKDSPLISYLGCITSVLDSPLGIYVLDDKFEFYSSFHCSHSFSLRVGSKVSLHNVHIIPSKEGSKYIMATLVACVYSSIHIQDMAPKSPLSPIHSRYTHRKWISRKYSSIYEVMQARKIKDALSKVLYFSNDPDSLQDHFAIETGSRQIICDLSLFAQPTLKRQTSNKDVNILDFMTHSEKCRFTADPPSQVDWLTPLDLLNFFNTLAIPENYEKGYHYLIRTHDVLGLSNPVLLGILDSDASGQLKLIDGSGSQLFVTIEECPAESLSLSNKKHLWAFKKFTLVTEICGYVKLGHYTLKQYVRLTMERSKHWRIYDSETIQDYQWVFKLLYKRPVSMDCSRPGVVYPTSVLEGMIWPKDSLENGHTCLLQLSQGALANLPFLNESIQSYFWVRGMGTQVGEEIVIDLTEEGQLSPCSPTDPDWHRFDELEKRTVFSNTLHVVDITTLLTGYEAFKSQEGMFEELVSIRGRVVSKSTASVASWTLDWGMSPKELSDNLNIGMGFLDRTVVLKIQDLHTPVSFNIYCDVRKTAYPLDVVPNNVAEFRLLGIQMSKSRHLYGIILPITSVDVVEKRSSENVNIRELPSTLMLCDVSRYTATFRVLCSVMQVRKVSFKRNFDYISSEEKVSVYCNFKIEDGTMEAYVDLFSLKHLQALLDVSFSVTSEWERLALSYGDYTVLMNDEFDTNRETSGESAEPLVLRKVRSSIKLAAQSIVSPLHCIATCTRRERPEKPIIRNLKLHGSSEGPTPMLCHGPLRLKLLHFQRNIGLMDIVDSANLWET